MRKIFYNTKKAAVLMLVYLVCICYGYNYFPVSSKADTQEEYDNINRQLEELKAKQSNLDSEYVSLNNALTAAGAELAAIEEQINTKQLQIDAVNEEMRILNNKIDIQHEAMKLRIKFMYENGTASAIEHIFSAESFKDLLVKAEYVRKISEYDHDKLEEMHDMMLQQTELKMVLDSEMTALILLRDEAINKQATVNSLIIQCRNNIDSNSRSIKDAEALALEYEERIRQEMLERQRAEMAAQAALNNPDAVTQFIPGDYDANDLAMLAAIIECEAGNQPYEGKCAVGSVVLNRVCDPRFANTIEGVLYAPYQFSPVGSGRFAIVLARGATASCYEAAAAVLNGYINIDALYFHVYDSESGEEGTVIGDHIFM